MFRINTQTYTQAQGVPPKIRGGMLVLVCCSDSGKSNKRFSAEPLKESFNWNSDSLTNWHVYRGFMRSYI